MNLRRVCAGLGAVVSMALLVSCGGNASRIEPYRPTSMVVLGDESSLIIAGNGTAGSTAGNGLKYTINYIDQTGPTSATNGQLLCASNAIWPQFVAAVFGFDFEACASTTGPLPRAVMKAAYGKKVADVVAQANDYQTNVKPFDPKTIVTVMAGTWDLIAIYNAHRGDATAAPALALSEAAGAQLGNLINSITASGNGGRVIYANLPNLSLTPFAAAESDAGRQLLSAMSEAFNNGVGVPGGKGLLTVTNNGKWAAIVTADVIVSAMAAPTPIPNAYGLTNVNTAACTTALPGCTNNGYPTVPTDVKADAIDTAGINRYLWAGDLQLGPAVHAQIGAQAQLRALNNPF